MAAKESGKGGMDMQDIGKMIPESMLFETFFMHYNGMFLEEVAGKMVYIPQTKRIREIIEKFPQAEQADGVLGYTYIDHEEGLSVEIICNARLNKVRHPDGGFMNNPVFFALDRLVHETIHFDQIDFDSVLFLPSKTPLYSREILTQVRDNNMRFMIDAGLNVSRSIKALDPMRHKSYPDEFILFLADQKGNLEPVWARFEFARPDGVILASLRDQPDPRFGIEPGKPVSVQLLPNHIDDFYIQYPVHYYGHSYRGDLEDFYRSYQKLMNICHDQNEDRDDDPGDDLTDDDFFNRG